jgi:sugar phosphate isomerase/epimerase
VNYEIIYNCCIRYPVTHWELIDFVDTWKDPSVGICWDFGHANFAYRDQATLLKAIGKRLKAVHVQDNPGNSDMHYAPYLGTVDWETAMKTLADIGYEGDLTLEIGNYTSGKPDAIQEILAKSAFDNGNYLIALYRRAKAAE